jgi:hypothetical protein
MVSFMITGNETIKELLNKRQSKDYNTDGDYLMYHLLYGYLMLNIDKNDCLEIDNELVCEIASFLEDSEYLADDDISEFFDKDCFKMFEKAKDEIWNGDYAWEGTTKFDFIQCTYEVEITDEQYHYQRKMDDMIDEHILRQRCEEVC